MCMGVPGRIVSYLDEEQALATAEVNGQLRRVNLALLADDGGLPETGSWVLVHLGFGMSRLTPDEAAETTSFLSELGRLPGE
jgi:hydrogenase expression/formation protein HypC